MDYVKKTRSSCSIRVVTESLPMKRNKNKNTLTFRIHLQIGNVKKETKVSTGKHIDPDKWDNTKKAIKGNKDDARRINSYLTKKESEVINCFEELKYQNKLSNCGDVIKIIRHEVFGRGLPDENRNTYLLLGLFDRYIELKPDLSEGRKKKIKLVRNRVSDFNLKIYNCSDIELIKLDREWYRRFQSHIQSEHKLANSTLRGYMKTIRTVVDDAVKDDILPKSPFKRCILPKEEKRDKWITKDELARIASTSFTNSRTQQVADCFIFASQTGLSHKDMKELKTCDIRSENGDYFISKVREKSKVPYIAYLNEIAYSIIKKYSNHAGLESSKALPVIHLNEYNIRLKSIESICNIHTSNGALASHWARHTFANMWMDNNGDSSTLQRILGHTKIEQTLKYARITQGRVLAESKRIFSLNNKFFQNDLKNERA